MVPIAPSATTTRSARTARSVLIAPHFRQLPSRFLFSPQAHLSSPPSPPLTTLPRARHARGHPTSRANHVVLRETACAVLGGGESSSSTISANSPLQSPSPGSRAGTTRARRPAG